MTERHIVALGGGGFSDEPDNPLLDDYILSLVDRRPVRICFIGTASGDDSGYQERFREAFADRGCETAVLDLFRPTESLPAEGLLDQDVIYVGGGNTVNMLTLWRLHGIDERLEEAWLRGIVLGGLSAGSLCWFEAGPTDSLPGGMSAFHDGLGLLAGSHCPHYQNPEVSEPYERFVASGTLPGGIGADDGVGLHYVGRELHRVVSSRPGAMAYRVKRTESGVDVTQMTPDLLA